MNVTKQNFETVAAEIEQLLPSAAFVAIDEEMTGIGMDETKADTPAKRYLEMRQVASKYNIVQFGMALVHEKETEGELPAGSKCFEVRPYNFYIFPEKGEVNMEVSAIAFNSKHNMSWDTWIKEGVPYMNKEEAQTLKNKLFAKDLAKEHQKKPPTRSRIGLTKREDVKVTAQAFSALEAWLQDESKKEEIEFELMEGNPYLRKFMYQTMAESYPDLLIESRPTGDGSNISKMIVLRLSEDQKTERTLKLGKEKQEAFCQKIGFHRLFSALMIQKKPIVGQNHMFDILFAMSHFYAPLPETYPQFKEMIVGVFPQLYDTHYIATKLPQQFSDKSLKGLYSVFAEQAACDKANNKAIIDISLASGFERYLYSEWHEAGFDAYATAYVFANVADRALSPQLSPEVNGRTSMWRSRRHFNLHNDADDGVYVHIAGLYNMYANDVKAAFSHIKTRFRGKSRQVKDNEIQVTWLDRNTAFALLPEGCRDDVAAMLQTSSEHNGLTFTSWSQYVVGPKEEVTQEVEKLLADVHLTSAGEEPSQKRAKTLDDMGE